MAGNILGEPVGEIFDKQISDRQKLHAAGYNNVKRNPQALNYLNNRNAWIKMASGVSISGSAGKEKLNDLSSTANNYLNDATITNLTSTGLAENIVLFNTTQRYDKKTKKYVRRKGVRDSNEISTSIDKMYGGLGSNSRGLQPVPGITDISIECLNRGSIRQATVNIKAYNKFQFGVLELLYLRIGYFVMLEWGWDKYVSNVKNNGDIEIEPMGNTIIEEIWFEKSFTQNAYINAINAYRKQYKGNYDGFLGKVTNFTWKLNQDNTYDINIKLLTVGSVIESLNIKIPVVSLDKFQILAQQINLSKALGLGEGEQGLEGQEEIDESDNPIITNYGTDVISQYISETILGFTSPGKDSFFNNKDYLFAPNLVGPYSDKTNDVYTINRSKIPKNLRYYVRLGKFLEVLQNRVIYTVVNSSNTNEGEVEFDFNEDTNICNYNINLIPLAPQKVIFSTIFDEELNSAVSDDYYKNNPLEQFNKPLKTFAYKEKGVYYGKLMNVYLNLNFIQQAFTSAEDNKEKVSLLKFLNNICDGINESTGQSTNLEVVLKEDKQVIFIDQNQIKGYDSILTESKTPIELYGYNPDGSSTFVKSFDFQTKITPDLINMISAGASTRNDKDINAIPFSKWNQGLKNRVKDNVLRSKVKVEAPPGSKEDFVKAFKAAIIDETAEYNLYRGYDFEYLGVKIVEIEAGGVSGGFFNLFGSKRSDDAEDKELMDEGYRKYLQANIQYRKKFELDDPNSSLIKDKKELNNNYKVYITKAFGGNSGYRKFTNNEDLSAKTISTAQKDALYWEFDNKDFISQGKNSFKTYISKVNQVIAKENDSISSDGFIPLELGLDTDGISGFKIYNKLNVATELLPGSYPRALKFLLRKINHKVSNNVWDTSLGTFSLPVSKNPPPFTGSFSVFTSDTTPGILRTAYPGIPLIDKPDDTKLPFDEARSLIKEAVENKYNTDRSLLKEKDKEIKKTLAEQAAFAVILAEASNQNRIFNSPGGYNYAGIQTDTIKWPNVEGGKIIKRYRTPDSETLREFAVFESNKSFITFLVDRVIKKDGGIFIPSLPIRRERKGLLLQEVENTKEDYDRVKADVWTYAYINYWWVPPYFKEITPDNDKAIREKPKYTGKQLYNAKKQKYIDSLTI